MRDAKRVAALDAIVEIRRLQRSAAELAAARAQNAVLRADEQRIEAENERDLREKRWSQALAIDPATAGLWANAVRDGDEAARSAQRGHESAQEVFAGRRADSQAVAARADAARDLAQEARRRLQRAREEAALALLADRFAAGFSPL